jgi:dipeptidase
VGCSANRSRIGAVDLDDSDRFLASPNIFSLARDLGLWEPGKPFIWREVYGGPGGKYNSLREWRALSLAAPSLGLQVTGDPAKDRYPFSVRPDSRLSVQALVSMLRDGYEGTPFDLTAHAAFQVKGARSPLARPWGAPELFELLGLEPERALCTPTSGYVFVAQLRDSLPDAVGNCLWFAYGPANTSCFVPVYAGVTDLPDAWDHPANFTRIDREQPQWNFRLVHNLTNRLRYQDAIRDVRAVLGPAEEAFLRRQADLERAAVRLLRSQGPEAVERFLTDDARRCTTLVGSAYRELVDFLMLKYLVGDPELATPVRPKVVIPGAPAGE